MKVLKEGLWQLLKSTPSTRYLQELQKDWASGFSIFESYAELIFDSNTNQR